MSVQTEPTLAIIAGVLILIIPRLLNNILVLYLIVIGISGFIR